MLDNKGTPMSIINAANSCLGVLPSPKDLSLVIDREVKNPDGTRTIYFTTNCDIKKPFVPRVAQHDLDTCCGTTANNVQNLAYVKQLEDKVKFMDNLIEAYQCDTLYQFARHVSMLAARCKVLTQHVNQFKQNPFNGGSF